MSGGASPRRKGANYEREGVAWLKRQGINVERRISGMSDDTGDITGWPGVCIDFKNRARIALAEWIDQLRSEAERMGAVVAVLIVKRPRRKDIDDHYVVMTPPTFMDLMRSAGLAPPLPPPEEKEDRFRALCWCQGAIVDVTPEMTQRLETLSCGRDDCRKGNY